MEIVRKFLSPDEIDPPNTRYNPDCDCVETRASPSSPWLPDPAADPRYGTRFLLPPREGSNIRCDAAEAMMQHFKAQVDAFLTSLSILQFINSVLTLAALFIPGLGILSKAIFVVAEALITIGTSVVDAAMTEEVYEQIKCIIFCNIDDFGQMSAAQLAQIQSQIDTEIGGTPNLVFDLFAGLWGEVGWSNAGATGEVEGECDECVCGNAYKWDFQVSNADWGIVADRGDGRTGQGFISIYNFAGFGNTEIRIYSPSQPGKTITRYIVEYSAEAASDGGVAIAMPDGGTLFSAPIADPGFVDEEVTYTVDDGYWRLDMSVAGDFPITIKTFTIFTDDFTGLTGGSIVEIP